jgi:hypothetical protein
METVYRIEDFVISHLFRPYAQDFIYADFNYERAVFEAMQRTIEGRLRKRPEYIIELLENMPETKKRAFNRIAKFGGVKFYKYLDMETELIKYIKKNLAEMGE